MDFLSLLGGSGLSGTDGPNRLVSDDDLGHVLSGEVIEDILDLSGNDIEMLPGLSLLKILTNAKDHTKTGGEGPVGLAVVKDGEAKAAGTNGGAPAIVNVF